MTTAMLMRFDDGPHMNASNAPPDAEPPETGRSAPACPQRLLVSRARGDLAGSGRADRPVHSGGTAWALTGLNVSVGRLVSPAGPR